MKKWVCRALSGLLMTLVACAGVSRPIVYRQDRDLLTPFAACKHGPFRNELLGPVEDVHEIGELRIVRQRVPAGVAAPAADVALGANTFTIASTATDRWMYGVKDHADRWLLPCFYDQVVCGDGAATAFHRVGGDVFVSAASVTVTAPRIEVRFSASYDYDSPYSSHQVAVLRTDDSRPPVVERQMLVQRDAIQVGERRWQGFRGVPAGARNTNDSEWPAYLASHHARVVGAEDSFNCLNRHVWPNRHGVWFCAPRGNGGLWQMWFWAADTGAVTEHDDVRCIVRRSEQDSRALPLLARPAPGDANLLWPWHEDTRQFAAPPGTSGVVPLTFQVTRQAPIHNLLRPTPQHGDQWKDILLTTGYSTTVDEFLVAYDVGGVRRWGTMNRELGAETGPIYARIEFRRSQELERRLHYRAKEHGVSSWVLAQRQDDSAWSIGHGRVAARAESFLREPPERLVEAAEAMVADLNREQLRRYRLYEDAQRSADREFEHRELLRKERLAAAEAEQARLAKAAAERAATERAAPSAPSGGGGGESYEQWRKSTWASIEANQRGLTGSAFSSYMDRYGR